MVGGSSLRVKEQFIKSTYDYEATRICSWHSYFREFEFEAQFNPCFIFSYGKLLTYIPMRSIIKYERTLREIM